MGVSDGGRISFIFVKVAQPAVWEMDYQKPRVEAVWQEDHADTQAGNQGALGHGSGRGRWSGHVQGLYCTELARLRV